MGAPKMRCAWAVVGLVVSACTPFGESAATPDAAAPTDSSGGAPTGAWCAMQTDFHSCFDFDSTGPVNAGWTGERGVGAFLRRDTSQSLSPPSSLLAESTGESGYLELGGVPGTGTVTLDLFVKLEVRGSNGVAQVAELAQGSRNLIVYAEPVNVYLKEYKGDSPTADVVTTLLKRSTSFSTSSWTHLVLELSLARMSVRAIVDEEEVISRPLMFGWAATDVTVSIGPGQVFDDKDTLRRYRFDNVIVRAK